MLSGFNTNVRYRGVRFHVQTEDSGRAHPHVITHLYHGGTILASEKRSYADRLDSAELESELRGLMEGQHAGMVQKLRTGELDAVIAERLGAGALTPKLPDAPVRPVAPTAASAAAGSRAAAGLAPAARATGAAPSRERPLDEEILDYLVESARKRKRRVQ